jgi:hypothetical protein
MLHMATDKVSCVPQRTAAHQADGVVIWKPVDLAMKPDQAYFKMKQLFLLSTITFPILVVPAFG